MTREVEKINLLNHGYAGQNVINSWSRCGQTSGAVSMP
jgi:hypothetical protein